ncbi:T9SS type B sorting domain-containing protein [Arenibacter sp. BSSL-BM3]|uniref:T9SS type B sorting domain-containing protein n=1 Tax=Arenibacter arenosicollis TaxID=2762274 RepID=A0ABR7QIM8_9FLAO|nr:T9SS type B sorting domain-containing protein [Arenibacter arenosicollis]MBC8766989.1 T9SS type B sorting domain-containing protein [Arenibacter arenosicollis]
MNRLVVIFGVIWYLGTALATAQVASDCSNAVPICNNTPVNGGTNGFGADDFKGAAKSGCLEKTLSGAIESNAAWYRFRTGASGQLGFNIGFDSSEDWDFALYKARDCNSLGDPVRCNFFDNREANSFIGVGEDPKGDVNNVQYEEWLEVLPGEDYYLLVNNFSNINSGFSIQFTGQIFVTNPYDALDCSIVSNLLGPPIAACDNETIVLDATTADVVSYTWYKDVGNGYALISGEVSATLTVLDAAFYRVEVITQSQNNIISDVQVGFSVAPTTSPVSDENTCLDAEYFNLSQKDQIALGGQSEEEVIISYHATAANADAGLNALPLEYKLIIGEQQIYIRATSVQNPRCYDASQDFTLTVHEPLAPEFPMEVFLCEGELSAVIGETSPDVNYDYQWSTGEITSSITVVQGGEYSLTISDKLGVSICDNTFVITVFASKTPHIKEVIVDDLQESNTITIIPDREGDFEYRLDDGTYQSENTFYDVLPGAHKITLNDLNGCGTATESIVVVGFPKFFTPNGDGANDVWNVVGISSLEEAMLFVYDRYGKLLKQLSQNSMGWDGTYNGVALPSGDYWFKLSYLDQNGQRTIAKYVNNHFSLKR